MNNQDYWKRRFELLEEAQNQDAQQVLADLERQFMAAQRTLDDQIRVWYQRFADNNQISLADARKWLTGRELAELRWNVQEYIRYGQENALNGQWMKQLENASARFHISRLEALKLQTQNTMEQLYGNQLDAVDSLVKRTYLDRYYRTAYEVQRGVGVGWDIAGVSDKQVASVLSKPWTLDDQTFSDRIWSDKQRLVNEVHTQLTQNMILGKAPDDAIKAIAQRLGASKSNAGRVVMTESAYFANQADKDAYDELGVERARILGTLDSTTCELCGAMDGQIIKVSEYAAGVSTPPFHPWCRCTTVPEFDDDTGERFARDADGNATAVSQNMTYSQWKKQFVDNIVHLGSGKSDASAGHPEFIGKFDPADLDTQLKIWENEIRNADIEHAYVWQPDGSTYHAVGSDNSVTIAGIDLTGAVVTHNHPLIGGVSDSFGSEDYSFLVAHPELKELRAVNENYDYSIRVLKELDIPYNYAYRNGLDPFAPDDEKQHSVMEWLKQEGYIEYIRKIP